MRHTREDARCLLRILKRALARPEALAWRKREHPWSTHWDDGPCAKVAKALACFDKHRGQVVAVNQGYHAVYRIGIWDIDGHRIERASETHNLKEQWWVIGTGTPHTLVRLLREEAEAID